MFFRRATIRLRSSLTDPLEFKGYCRALAGAILLPMVSAQVCAQSTPNPDAEQRREQERVQVQRLQLERTPDIQTNGAPRDASLIPTGETPCFKIERIGLDNADSSDGSLLAPPTSALNGTFDWLINATAGPDGGDSPIGKCLGANGVQLVIKRAQEAAIARGYVTTRVLVQRQDLTTGTLVLTVIPGRVSAIRFIGTAAPGVRSFNALPLRSGDILNLRDIEQGLENLKRVPTAQANIAIEPALDTNAFNYSDLVIAYEQPTRTRWSFSADDSGSQGTGRYQGSASFSLDNPLGLSDLFYLTLSHDLGGGDEGARGTRGYTAHYSLPFDYWSLASTYSSSRYFQSVAGQSQSYVYSGTSENTEVKLSRLLYRDAVRKTGLSVKAWQRKSNNFIDDTEVQVQRRVVGGWEMGINHKDALGGISVEGNLVYRRGTNDFDSIPAPEEAFNEGSSRLGLLLLDLSASVPFKAAGQTLKYSAALRTQDNTTALTPQDRFAIGGRYTVRGYDGESSLVGERGWTLRNDVSVVLENLRAEAYMAVDAGEVGGPSSERLVANTLTGAAVGLRGSYKKLQYDVFVGAPLNQPPGFKTAQTAAGFNFTLSL